MPVNTNDAAEFIRMKTETMSGDDNKSSRRGVTIVELFKKDRTTLGLIISGGSDKESKSKIASLRPGSIAYRSDLLCVGDNILSVNGIRTAKLKHEEIANLLKNAGDRVLLEVEYDLPCSAVETSPSVCSKVIQVRLEKENGSFGFVLRGGVNVGCPLTVTHVRPGGPADREGTIKSGDRLLAIDSCNLHNVSCGEIGDIFGRIEHEAVFTVEYDVSLMEAVRNASGPLLVEIDRGLSPANQQLGVCLSASPHNLSTILIQSIKQASLAERCGALHVGDQLLAIDGVTLDSNATAAEASQLLRNSCGDRISLEILPLSQMLFGKRLPDVSVRKGTMSPSSVSSFATLSGATSRRNNNGRRLVMQPSSSNTSLPSCTSSCSAAPTCVQVCRSETTEVALNSDYRGYGFALRTNSSASHPVIGSFDPGGPAECSGAIQVGDRVLAVDGMSTDGLSIEQITRMISASKPKVTLLMEFDVAESVVPSSGVFDIKLTRNHGVSLGISITAAKDCVQGEPPVISEVRRGSIAHRSGTIQVGDQLLAIGDQSIDGCSINEAIERLQENRDDVVCLRIRKGAKGGPIEETDEEQELLREGWVIYSVELKRMGNGPLGITLSGSDEPNRPIIVSAVTEAGIADKTGALHPGDRLLAIDGRSVKGLPLGQVIQQLQNSVDSIFLKVSKCQTVKRTKKCLNPLATDVDDTEETSKCGSGGTPESCIDSAVESWDGEESATNSIVARQHRASPTTSKELEDFDEKEEDADQTKTDTEWRRNSSNSSRESHLSEEEEEEPDRDWVKILSEFGAKDTTIRHGLQRQMSEENLTVRGWSGGHNTTCSTLPHGCGRQGRPRAMTIDENGQSAAPHPIELHRVTLFKDSVYEDFGFSVSDGLYERGVYVNRIRPGGPADTGGILKPFDRILQVNDTKTHDFDCCLTVPLIAAAGDRIHLVVVRNPCSSGRGIAYSGIPWMEEEEKETSQMTSVISCPSTTSTIVKSF